MTGRGMKKWAPYASLIEQKGVFRNMVYEKRKSEKPILSDDQIIAIENILNHYQKETVTITYFKDGYIETIVGVIKRIDATYKFVFIIATKIFINDILNIEFI